MSFCNQCVDHRFRGLASKLQDEAKALELCRSKVRQRKLPMEVVDAEYQWYLFLAIYIISLDVYD